MHYFPLPRILIITNGPLCRNPRPLKEAETLGQAGYDVTVLMVRNHAPSEPYDLALMRTAPFRREAVDLIPGYRASRARLLWRRGLLWAARNTPRAWRIMDRRSLGPTSVMLHRARSLQADLTIVHNEAAHWAGTRLLAAGRRVAADIEDWHSEDLLPEARFRRPLRLIRAVERGLLHRAAYTTTTSHALAGALHERYGGRQPEVISNSFPLQKTWHGHPAHVVDNTGKMPVPRKETPAFFWFSQTIGPGRGLELFLAAWARTTQSSRVVLLGEPEAGYASSLLARLPVEKRVRVSFRPLVSPAELPDVIAEHDIGLALEQGFIVNRDLTITNKILQYLNAGLTVVASDTAGQREVLAHAPDAGVIVRLGETTDVAATLDRLLGDQEGLARRQTAARRLAEQVYCWEKEAPRLHELVEKSLK